MMTRLSLLFLFALFGHAQGQTLNFTGPGLVGCPATDYLLNPCDVVLPDACASRDDCQNSSQLPSVEGFILLALPCDCAVADGCPSTCEFSETPGPSGNSTGADFTGPGYLSCNYTEWDATGGCASLDFDPLCPTILDCNVTGSGLVPTLDSSGAIIYIPLICECVFAFDCPESCVQSDGDPPAPTPVSATLNFTGVGTVTCPFAEFFALQGVSPGQCFPTVLNNDITACGSCDFQGQEPDYQAGDEFITIPLPCDCLALFGCPDSCLFEAGVATPTATGSNTTMPPSVAPIPSGNATAPVEAPVVVPVAVPVASPVANVTAPTPANVTAPTPANASKPVAAPVKSPVAAPTNSTSSSAMFVRGSSVLVMTLLGWMVL